MKPSTFSDFLVISNWKLTPYQILSLGFAGLIFAGTALLMLPVSSVDGLSMRFVDALFTATSAVCVTGLVVVDTGKHFTLFGQTVIIGLVQVGALGIMTMATLMAVVMRKKIQLRDRLVMQEALNQLTFSGVVRLVLYVIQVSLLIEFVGGTLLAFFFYQDFGSAGIYFGYWHAISAFCNAGFDVFGSAGGSAMDYVGHLGVNLVLTFLVILGGLGFSVLSEIKRHNKFQRYSLHTKVVLTTTVILIFLGTFSIFLLEYNNIKTLGNLSLEGKVLGSYFQAAAARTAGYSTIHTGNMADATLFLVLLLMFIGASPGSTGSGIKTTTFAVIVSSIWSMIRGRNEAQMFYRRIPSATVYKAFAIFFTAASLIVSMTMILSISEDFSFIQILFEVVSAFSTTGLSTGITAGLSDYGKLCLVLTMFVGRIGPVTFALALAMKSERRVIQYPEGKISIG